MTLLGILYKIAWNKVTVIINFFYPNVCEIFLPIIKIIWFVFQKVLYKMKLIKAKVLLSCIFPCALKPDNYFYFFIFSFEGERPSKCRSIQRKTHQTHSVSKILWTRRLPNCPWTWFERKQNSLEGKSFWEPAVIAMEVISPSAKHTRLISK